MPSCRTCSRSRRWTLGLALALGALLEVRASAPAAAQVFLTQEEALRLAFPAPATIGRRTAFLNGSQIAQARALAGRGVEIDQTVVTYYVGAREGTPLGAAYFDVHRVRTLSEVLMIVVTPDERIERIEVLKFAEPPEYRASSQWIEQFHGRALTDDLSLKASIRNMTGASLTSQAVTRASRRVLALHQVIQPFDKTSRPAGAEAPPGGGAPSPTATGAAR